MLFTFLLLLLASKYESVICVINGEETTISKFPFLVEVSLYGVKGHPLCGATIIDKSWAVSAAHCFKDIDGKRLTIEKYLVISGTNYAKEMISKDKITPHYHNITKYYMNEDFGAHSPEKDDGFDISVFKVDPPFAFDKLIAPAKLPKQDEMVHKKWATSAGWGCTKLGGSTSAILRSVKVPKVTKKTCMKYYPTIMYDESVLCYGTPRKHDNPQNICQGDSGGPLIAGDDLLIGVVSMSKNYDASIPALYTRVAFYRDWIKEKTGV